MIRHEKRKRTEIGRSREAVIPMPHLLAVQIESYENFLQRAALRKGEKVKNDGLEAIFQSFFPIKNPSGDIALEYDGYYLADEDIRFDEETCKEKGCTYQIPLKARLSLVFHETGEIRQKDTYMGDVPLMTDNGTFIINGAERVVVSQMSRCPGMFISSDKGLFSARVIPHRGSWIEFEIDSTKKTSLIYVKIDRKKRFLATSLLRMLGYDTRSKIIQEFYVTKKIDLSSESARKELRIGAISANTIYKDTKENEVLLHAGERLHPHVIDAILENPEGVVELVDLEHANSLHSPIIINCLEQEEAKTGFDDVGQNAGEQSEDEAGGDNDESNLAETVDRDFFNQFFSPRSYDLGKVGRYKLNKKFSYNPPVEERVLVKDDIINTIRSLVAVYCGEQNVDDIDHLGSRRIRTVGELLDSQIRTAFTHMERTARSRIELKESNTIKPQDLIAIKSFASAIRDFFASSQLAQFMDQINPLAELTHKRRLNALGPGGLSRERAGFEVRDVHYTHYGRMCPIETPEGPNIGLIVSLANYARINEFGFLETPYRRVSEGIITKDVQYLSAMDEENFYIAQANAAVDKKNSFIDPLVSARRSGDYLSCSPEDINYIDVSPKQVISISASLIPFLEHDDANRALMGSNMQRQAVPLLFAEAPRVGTGMETKIAYDSGVVVKSKRAGVVEYASNEEITIKPEGGAKERDSYRLTKYRRTNQDTCFNHRPMVRAGDIVKAGEVIADGPATDHGELALGQNVLVGIIPWNGYNYEDAILVSERIVKQDVFTSIHIREFTAEIRETKFGPETITPDIPNTSTQARAKLTDEGVIKIGTHVSHRDILVGKVTPKPETETTPEFKLLNQIFGEKAKDVRDTSLRVPHGVEGVVIDIKILDRNNHDELSPGVSKIIKLLIASKRKLTEGDKMAGRHGNKGVVSRVLPEEDMPFMADGTPIDICLNPLGVPSRMNLGQILETQLGWAAYGLDEWYASPVFESATQEQIVERLKTAKLPVHSKVQLFDGRTGEAFKNEIMVGCMYMLKLHHLVDDKMHARSTGPYSLVTQQPLGGKAQFGGQRLGEMEVWALEAYGAANTLQELLTIKSDDIKGRTRIYEAIVKGETTADFGVPESFNVLMQELRGLCMDLSIYDSKQKSIPLTERDKELISRQDGNF